MRHLFRYAYLLAILPLAGCRQNDASRTLEVTYIANEGFMISMGGTKVLIDAFSLSEYYASPSDSTVARLIDGTPPFDGIDYLLVTHDHPDHFNAEMVSRFLLKHPTARFIASSESCSKLKGGGISEGQLTRVDLKRGEQRILRGEKAEILAFSLMHGSSDSMDNLAFLVHSNEHTIVHVGDAKLAFSEPYLRKMDWSSYTVDLLFLQHADRSTPTQEIVQQLIRPNYVVLMHIPPGEEEEARNRKTDIHPRAFVFSREGETKRFDKVGEPVSPQ